MKKLFLLCLLATGILFAAAQSLTLSDANGPLEHDQLITLTAPPDSTEIIKVYIYVTNNSGASLNLLVKKEELEILPGTFNSFCWAGSCYPPFIFVAPDMLTLGPGETSSGDDFYGEYSPEQQVGFSDIRYTFYDSENINDSVSVIVRYNTIISTQSLSLSDANSPLEHDEVVVMSASPDTEIMKKYIYVTNNSDEAKHLLVKKEELDILAGTFNSFCWAGSCYPPFIFVAPDMLTLGPGEATSGDDFYGEYSPEGHEGTSIIRYTFFDSEDVNDSVSVIVHYITTTVGTGGMPVSLNNTLSRPYPNPASTIVNFDVELDTHITNAGIVIRNLLGSVVLEQPVNLHESKVSIPMNHLREGIYFYSLAVGEEQLVQTGRFIVKK
ncbi:MAG TPA: T9SS type A sorting domain-containing protein [Bacteroidales bacterium]|nr:T9SS type A sorting domain-containing protein [Bacteroidales bacterium]